MEHQFKRNEPNDSTTFVTELSDLRDRIGRLTIAAANTEAPVRGAGRSWVTEWRLRRIQKLRAKRNDLFEPELFADPAWEMLLDLYGTHLSKGRTSVSSLCIASGVPSTTALRWLKKLERHRWIIREPDETDCRRFFLHLSPKAITAMERFFDEAACLIET